MATCASCGTEGIAPGRACPHCGALEAAALELDLRAPPPPKPRGPKPKAEEPLSLELAVDPRELVAQRAAGGSAPQWPRVQAAATGAVVRGQPPFAQAPQSLARPHSHRPAHAAVDDDGLDAHVLADLGESPTSWLKAPMYAWRVLRRQRELREALVARRAEAEHAATEVEDALVAFAERARVTAEKVTTYAVALEDLQRAEDMLRSRDKVLAAEQDAQKARQAQVDSRLAKLESDLLAARDEERGAASALAASQSALAREEAKLKRAEAELKTAQQVEQRGSSGAGTT
jgi:hypothetical protein